MTLFQKNNVLINLNNLYFDESIDGAVVEIEICNNSDEHIDIDVRDIWMDNEWFSLDTIAKNITPHSSVIKKIYYLSTDDNEERIVKFQNSEIETITCLICVRKSNSYNYVDYAKSNRIQIRNLSMTGIEILPDEEFEIEYDDNDIFASSNYSIPFEFSKSQTQKNLQIRMFTKELIKKISLMPSPKYQKIFVARYGETGSPRFFDIENMCIYNLGTSTFSKCCPTDIVFSELTANDISTAVQDFGISPNRKYYYSYSWLFPKELEDICSSKTIVAKWNSVLIKTDIPNNPYRYWLSIREQHHKIEILNQTDISNFGIKIILHLPKKILPASIMKPLIDGVVSSFHKSHNIDNVLRLLVKEKFENVITNAEKNISLFGERNYVNTYKGNLKWNPADDRLKFAWISIVTEDCTPYFDGEIYQW